MLAHIRLTHVHKTTLYGGKNSFLLEWWTKKWLHYFADFVMQLCLLVHLIHLFIHVTFTIVTYFTRENTHKILQQQWTFLKSLVLWYQTECHLHALYSSICVNNDHRHQTRLYHFLISFPSINIISNPHILVQLNPFTGNSLFFGRQEYLRWINCNHKIKFI